jgi:hypothetical protein
MMQTELAEASHCASRGDSPVNKGRLRATAARVLHRNNAQEILQALANLEEQRAEFAR